MRRQRSMAQMKKENKMPEKKPNKIETSNLLDAEFKTLFIRVLKELSEDLNSIKNFQSETKETLPEIKNNFAWKKNRVDEDKIQINDMGHKEAEKNNQNNKQKEDSKN